MLLSEGPMHAYQIEKTIEGRSMRYWTEISMSSIYKLLRKLQTQRLIASKKEPSENGLLKNVFRLTAAGRGALEKRITEFLSEPEHMRWRIDLATSHLDVLPIPTAMRCLETYRAKLEETIEGYRNLDRYLQDGGCRVHARALARRPIHLLKGEMGWLDSYIKELREGKDA